jgi:endonuclease/exonuclease/phosphatase family metal-dependent hydrolase
MATVHQGQHCESFKVATLNVHEWLDSNGLENTERLADVINPLHLDLLALEEVLHTDSLTMLAKLLGMPFIAFADGDLHGNAFLSRHKFLKTKSKLVSIDTHDKRSMLQVNLDHPFALENRIDFYVTHLDHAVETVRIQQLDEFKTMWTTNGNIQVVLGDFNSLTLSDYTPNYLKVQHQSMY